MSGLATISSLTLYSHALDPSLIPPDLCAASRTGASPQVTFNFSGQPAARESIQMPLQFAHAADQTIKATLNSPASFCNIRITSLTIELWICFSVEI